MGPGVAGPVRPPRRPHPRRHRSRALAVEHVGSTSVPGLPAKPIIDIDVTVADPRAESTYVPELEAVGIRLRLPRARLARASPARGGSPPGERARLRARLPGAGPPPHTAAIGSSTTPTTTSATPPPSATRPSRRTPRGRTGWTTTGARNRSSARSWIGCSGPTASCERRRPQMTADSGSSPSSSRPATSTRPMLSSTCCDAVCASRQRPLERRRDGARRSCRPRRSTRSIDPQREPARGHHPQPQVETRVDGRTPRRARRCVPQLARRRLRSVSSAAMHEARRPRPTAIWA